MERFNPKESYAKKWNMLNDKYHLFSNLNKLKFDFYIFELY